MMPIGPAMRIGRILLVTISPASDTKIGKIGMLAGGKHLTKTVVCDTMVL